VQSVRYQHKSIVATQRISRPTDKRQPYWIKPPVEKQAVSLSLIFIEEDMECPLSSILYTRKLCLWGDKDEK
jgi:hypothetical protein